jgi:uncharacterized protein YndB with AHSA1/START domain
METSTTEVTWAPEREIVLSRVLDAPRELVFGAWTEKDGIGAWFGPNGFKCTTHEMDVRVGGMWRFDLVAPDGQRFDNRIVYLEVDGPRRLVFDHGSDVDDDPNRFRVTVTFDRQGDDKTVLTLRQLHPTEAQRDTTIDFGAVELGYQTLDKLAAYLNGR